MNEELLYLQSMWAGAMFFYQMAVLGIAIRIFGLDQRRLSTCRWYIMTYILWTTITVRRTSPYSTNYDIYYDIGVIFKPTRETPS